MSLVSPQQVNPGDEIAADSINAPVNQIAKQVNGNLDDSNITSISGSKVQEGTLPGAALEEEASAYLRMSESLGDFMASGGVWSGTSGLNGTMTEAVSYIDGKRLTTDAVPSHTFDASRDTYVYIDAVGSVQYVAVVNDDPRPATPGGHVLDYKVVTDASTVTSVLDVRQRAIGSMVGGFKVGVIPKSTFASTGSKSVDGIGFRPKLIRLSLLVSSGSTLRTASGAMTASDQYCETSTSGGAGTRSHFFSDRSIAFLPENSQTPQMSASYVSMDEDGFTINVHNANDAFDVSYEASA